MRAPISAETPSSRQKGSLHARLAAGTAAIVLFLAACGGTASPSPIPTASPVPRLSSTPSPISTPIAIPTTHSTPAPSPMSTPVPTPTATATVSAAPSAASVFPLTITDDEGTSVTIPAEPERIVSLSPSNTEITFALGAGDRLVGGTDADDYPAQAAALPHVVQQGKVLREQIASLDADLVLANGNGLTAPGDIQSLRDQGLPVVVLTAQSVDAVEKDIELIGQVIGEEPTAEATVATMENQFAAISAEVATTTDRPRTFYEVYYDPTSSAPLFGIAKDSAYQDLITLAGGDPITTGDPVNYAMSLEALIAADPQVILLGDAMYGTCPADVTRRADWKKITAVVDGAVRPVYDEVITRPGPRMVQGLASLVRGIHPVLTLPDQPADPPMCGGG